MFPICMKKIYQKWFPPFLMFVMALWFFGKLQTPKDKDFAFTEFGQLPVTANGRIVPMDSLARNSLLEIREKQTLNTEPWKAWNENPKIISAAEWLANMMMNPAVCDDWPVIRIDNPDLGSLLKLPDKDAAKKSDGKHYSWNQLQPSLATFDKENERVQKKEAASRTAYENAIAKMHQRLSLYAQLRNAVQPADAPDWPAELAAFEQMIPAGVAAAQGQQAGKEFDKTTFTTFIGYVHRLGRGAAGFDSGKIPQERHWRGRGGGHWFHHAHHRASPRARRRHDGNDARGAGHEFLARHARRRRDRRLREHVCGGIPRADLHPARYVHENFGCSHRQIPCADDLRHRLFRHVVQFCGHGAGRHLGGPVVGPVLGLGSQGKRRAHHRVVERAHPAFALGRPHPRARPRQLRHLRQRRHRVVVVRGQHAGHRAAQLWLHGGGVQMAGAVCGEPARFHRAGPAAGETVEKF